MKNKNSISLNKSISISNRALKIIFKKYPQMVISSILNSIWTAVTPYVGIYLSALIIEELFGSKNPEKLKVLVLITLITEAIIALISALLGKWANTNKSNLYFKFENFYIEKLFKMDFVSLDDIKTHELLSTIKQNQNSAGWGLFNVIYDYESLSTSIFTLLPSWYAFSQIFPTSDFPRATLSSLLSRP